MRRQRWSIAGGPDDFLPLAVGGVLLFLSLPAFLVLFFDSERNWGALGVPVMFILGGGVVIGLGFLVLGLQLCTEPGSFWYRIAHGRLFWR